MVSVAERLLDEVLAATVATIVELPVPDAADNTTQLAPDVAVQAQPACVDRETFTVAPEAATVSDAGETEKVQGAAPAWLTVTGCPAIVNVVLRTLVEVLLATETMTDPLPLLLAGVTVTQPAPEEAVHPHAASAATETVGLPPPAGNDSVVGETV